VDTDALRAELDLDLEVVHEGPIEEEDDDEDVDPRDNPF